jgi:hypothetical protein
MLRDEVIRVLGSRYLPSECEVVQFANPRMPDRRSSRSPILSLGISATLLGLPRSSGCENLPAAVLYDDSADADRR